MLFVPDGMSASTSPVIELKKGDNVSIKHASQFIMGKNYTQLSGHYIGTVN